MIKTLATDNTDVGIDGVKQVALLTREREVLKTHKRTSEQLFLVTNIEYSMMNAQEFMESKRDYWGVENKLHYRKDFVFGEDRSTIVVGYGPQNMASLRNFAIGLLTCNKVGNIKRCVDNLKHDPCFFIRMAA